MIQLLLALNIEMHTAPRLLTNATDVLVECNKCNEVFATQLQYDQYRLGRSWCLRKSACYALPDTSRANLYVQQRPNMSTTGR